MAKHKIACISLTVRDRAISSKFSTHRVSKECHLGNFPKIFPSPKMAAILNFRIFAKNGKTQNSLYLLNRARYSDFVEIFDPRGTSKFSTHGVPKEGMYSCQFSKSFLLPKNGVYFEFSLKMAKHKIACISLTVRDRAISSKFSTHRVSKEYVFKKFSRQNFLKHCFLLNPR